MGGINRRERGNRLPGKAKLTIKVIFDEIPTWSLSGPAQKRIATRNARHKTGRILMGRHQVKDIGPAFLQSAQVHALIIQRDMSNFAAHSLIDTRQTQIARILNRIHLVRAKQLNQHGIEQLGARTDNDVVGVDIHTPCPVQMVSNCASQPSSALRRCGRKDFALVFGCQRRP